MDNTVGQQDSESNAAEKEEGISTEKKENIGNVKGEEKLVAENERIVNISITETVLVQKDAVEGDTNQSSAAEEKTKINLSGPLKSEQQLIELQHFTKREQQQQPQQQQQQEQQQSIAGQEQEQQQEQQQQKNQQLNNLYYKQSNTMFSKSENQIASDSQSHAFYSEATDIDPKHLVEISEEGMLALQLVDMGSSNSKNNHSNNNNNNPNSNNNNFYSSLMSSGSPAEPLSSNNSFSNVVLVPKKIVRIERDYFKGELCQFQTAFPMEIDGRVRERISLNHSFFSFI